jgi:hypothetical protein
LHATMQAAHSTVGANVLQQYSCSYTPQLQLHNPHIIAQAVCTALLTSVVALLLLPLCFGRHHALVPAQDARLPQLPTHHTSRLHSLQPRQLQQPPTLERFKLRASTQPWACP